MKNICVCQSGKLFQQCCDRFLNQQQLAKTPVQLMRSRYSAFALGGYGEYLLKTWAPSMTSGVSALELSMRTTDWVGLEIVDKSQKGDQGFVEFKARFKDDSGRENVHHEKSVFERMDGRWLYVCGEVS
ncbi:MAG: YchJ family protein [Arenicella sp.]